MPEPVKVEVKTTGIADLRAVKGKGSIDYGDDAPPTPAAVAGTATPAAVPPQAAPTTPVDLEKKQAELQKELDRVRAQGDAYAQQQNAIIRNQEAMLQRMSTPAVAPEKEISDEEIAAIYQEDPIKATRLISQREAKKIREETMSQIAMQEQIQAAQTEFTGKQVQFQENLKKVHTENKELADPNHRLTQIYAGLEAEMPYLLRIPEGPVKALEIAKQRYELEVLKANPQTPAAPQPPAATPAATAQPSPAVRESTPRAATMVGGASRGVPPTTAVEMSDEEKLAARRMRLTPEEYGKFKQNTSQHFQKEPAPKRRTA